MLVEQVEALKSIQDAYVAMNSGQLDEGFMSSTGAGTRTADLSKISTETLTKTHAMHSNEPKGTRSYEQRQRVAAELKKRGVKVPVDEGFAHPNHKKLDANGNGKVDAQDFAMLRAKKKGIKNFKEFKEEVEQLDELSKKTLGSYIKHANIDSNDRAQFIGTEPGALKAIRKREKGISTAVNKLTKEDIEGLDEGTNIPVSRATDAVSKVMGQKGAVNFLAKLKPGNKTHTSWNEVNSALVDQGAQSAHIAKVAGHLKPTQYNEAED